MPRIKKGLKNGLAEQFKIKIGRKATEADRKDFFYIDAKKIKRRKTVKLKHFRLCKTSRMKPLWKGDKNNFELAPELIEAYGEKPTMLECTVPFDDIEKIFPTEYACYKKAKKFCSGDGQDAVRVVGEGKTKVVTCDIDTCPYMKEGDCKASGRLHVILSKAPRVGSVAVFRTHGWNSVSNIDSALESISAQTGGVLRGIPMRLQLLEKDSEFGAVMHVNIETVASDWAGVADHRIKELESRCRMGIDVKLIEAQAVIDGVIVDKDDPEEVEDEFFPKEKEGFAAQPSEDMASKVLDIEVEATPIPEPAAKPEKPVVKPVTEVPASKPEEKPLTHEVKENPEPAKEVKQDMCECGKPADAKCGLTCKSCKDLADQAAAYDKKKKADKLAKEKKEKKEKEMPKPPGKPTTCSDCSNALVSKLEAASGVCASCVKVRKEKAAQGREIDANEALEGDSF